MFFFLFRSENRAVIDATDQLFKLLEHNHNSSQNTSSLIRVLLTRATELKASAQCDK